MDYKIRLLMDCGEYVGVAVKDEQYQREHWKKQFEAGEKLDVTTTNGDILNIDMSKVQWYSVQALEE